ncbi:MAG: hypothetical protein A3B30_00990 [Candidatus Komeilibacteria bacterium RIFCSPLOWO2_01_FULL_52_15]|uniref:Uncharacterized protein n=1 Tax=Candidatus Komeilibacteria bacterium RIFCSPLOWO2_01_FULL_52_15 TaxID=1798551 RepID=A0A1G2BS55_9BACT|nr:MAG: hypothetical protein A3B30_00990 [Candidatus Komeilibacteria bacterium RIFCSPLOWO2_01_FULL_52_15]
MVSQCTGIRQVLASGLRFRFDVRQIFGDTVEIESRHGKLAAARKYVGSRRYGCWRQWIDRRNVRMDRELAGAGMARVGVLRESAGNESVRDAVEPDTAVRMHASVYDNILGEVQIRVADDRVRRKRGLTEYDLNGSVSCRYTVEPTGRP